MATYKIDRASNVQYSGKFKFDYRIDIGPPPGGGGLFQKVTAGAYPAFVLKSVEFSLFVGDQLGTDTKATPDGHPWEERGGVETFGNFLDGGKSSFKIPITFKITTKAGVLSDRGVNGEYTETVILYTEPYTSNGRPDKTLSGSIEGEFFVGLGTNEFVDIDEYYPSENYFIGSPVCPDNEDEYWRNKELTKDTIRQWPKYTSLNWYEVVDPLSKSYAGIKLKFTNPKGQVTTFSKSFELQDPSQLIIDLENSKFINAWTTVSANSGYVSISSNIPVDDGDPDFVSLPYSQCNSQNFSLFPFPNAKRSDDPKCTATIKLDSDPPRKVTFESKILDWNNTHTDPLTAYVIGFNSDGKNKKRFRNSKRDIALPTWDP
jgi:hypothetical protein